jgi:hypothetical protein
MTERGMVYQILCSTNEELHQHRYIVDRQFFSPKEVCFYLHRSASELSEAAAGNYLLLRLFVLSIDTPINDCELTLNQ